jgi:aspartate--ammonia ligase
LNGKSLNKQLELTHQSDFLKYPYHQAIVTRGISLSVGGGIGQSRTMMQILRKAHLGEVSVTM